MVFAGTGVWKAKRGTPLLGCRCVFINDGQYSYNVRDELISADEVSYNYDDIGIYAPTSVSEVGNRTTAEGKTYTANNLNQYTAIDDFAPQYDADGNQTLIKTETGVWSVVYNAENRPVRWTQGDTVITMAFDRMGRRVDYQETRDDQVATHFRFVYDNYLCVQRLDVANGNAVRTEFVWDPTEPIATRPLVMRAKNWDLNLFYTHDGNKNVSEVFYHALQNGIAAHYDYAPFGAVTRTSRATRVTNRALLSENPFRFSSEYHDAPLGLIYYNYRHYHSSYGRWIRRDKIGSYGGLNEYAYIENMSGLYSDFLGMAVFYYDAAGMNYNRIFEKTQKNVESFLEKLECISDEAFTQLVKDGKVKLDGESFTGNKEDFIQEVKHEAQSQQLSGQGLTFNAFKEDVRAKFQENIKSNNDVFIVGMHGTIENNPKPRHAQLMFTDCMIDTAKVEDFLKGLPNSGGRIELISCGRTFPPDYSNEQIGDCYNEGLWLIPASGKVDVMKCDISFSRMKARRIYGKGGKDAKMDLL